MVCIRWLFRDLSSYVYDINGNKYPDSVEGLWCTPLATEQTKVKKDKQGKGQLLTGGDELTDSVAEESVLSTAAHEVFFPLHVDHYSLLHYSGS